MCQRFSKKFTAFDGVRSPTALRKTPTRYVASPNGPESIQNAREAHVPSARAPKYICDDLRAIDSTRQSRSLPRYGLLTTLSLGACGGPILMPSPMWICAKAGETNVNTPPRNAIFKYVFMATALKSDLSFLIHNRLTQEILLSLMMEKEHFIRWKSFGIASIDIVPDNE